MVCSKHVCHESYANWSETSHRQIVTAVAAMQLVHHCSRCQESTHGIVSRIGIKQYMSSDNLPEDSGAVIVRPVHEYTQQNQLDAGTAGLTSKQHSI